MSTIIDTAANDPRVNAVADDGPEPESGVVLPDMNAEPTEHVTAQIDNNARGGVVIDKNVTPPDERGPKDEENEEALKKADEVEPEPDSPYIVDRRDGHAIDTPRSVYLSPPMDFKDPPDLEEPEAPEPLKLRVEPIETPSS